MGALRHARLPRHPRAGGDPSPDITPATYREMDSRLHGSDG
jgi:hypothetical protein